MHVQKWDGNHINARSLPAGTKLQVTQDSVSPQGHLFIAGQIVTFVKNGKNGWTLVTNEAAKQCWLPSQVLLQHGTGVL